MPIWLQKVGHFFQVLWTWLKGHWGLLLLGVGLVASLVFAKRKADSYDTLFREFQGQMAQNHRDLDELRKIQTEQIAAQREIDRKYREVVEKIDRDYRDQIQRLDAQKQQQLREIIAANNDDPEAMAREINGLFGIPIVTLPTSPATPL